jgi:hypothetical protein
LKRGAVSEKKAIYERIYMILSLTRLSADASLDPGIRIFLFFSLVIPVGIAIWAIQRALSRRRTEGMKTAALEMGFTFEGAQWADMRQAPLMEHALFGKGRGTELKNIMTGSRSGMKVNVFDYTLRIGTGRHSHTEAQTVVSFTKDGVYLPYFELRPIGPFDKMWDAVTHKNIHFDSSPEFMRRYVLRTPSENDVRSLFTPSVISFLEQFGPHTKWSIEGTGNTLIVFHSRKKISPAEVRPFLDETSSIASSFFSLANCPVDTFKK